MSGGFRGNNAAMLNNVFSRIMARRGGSVSGPMQAPMPQAQAPMPQAMPFPGGIVNPYDTGDGMAQEDAFGGAPSLAEGEFVPASGKPRPAPPVFASRQYDFPVPPAIPSFAPAPARNLGREARQGQKAAINAGLLGLLLGGLPGATMAAGGAMEGAQQAQDRLAEGKRQMWQDASQGVLQNYNLERQGYGDAMDRVGQQVRADNQADAIGMRQYVADLDDYSREQERIRRESSDADKNQLQEQRNQLQEQRNQNQYLLGLLGAGTRQTMADVAQQRANSYGKSVDAQVPYIEAKTGDIQADNNRADDALALRKSHDAWMRENSQRVLGMRGQLIKLREDAAKMKAAGGQVSPATKANILKQLTLSQFAVNAARESAGQRPSQYAPAEVHQQWEQRRKAAETEAQSIRSGFNEMASIIGYKWDGEGYSPVTQAPPPSRAMTPQEGVDMLSGTNRVEPLLLPSRRMPAARPTPKPVSAMTPEEKLAELAAIAGKK